MSAEQPTIAACPYCGMILLRTAGGPVHPMPGEQEAIRSILGNYWFEHSRMRSDGRSHGSTGGVKSGLEAVPRESSLTFPPTSDRDDGKESSGSLRSNFKADARSCSHRGGEPDPLRHGPAEAAQLSPSPLVGGGRRGRGRAPSSTLPPTPAPPHKGRGNRTSSPGAWIGATLSLIAVAALALDASPAIAQVASGTARSVMIKEKRQGRTIVSAIDYHITPTSRGRDSSPGADPARFERRLQGADERTLDAQYRDKSVASSMERPSSSEAGRQPSWRGLELSDGRYRIIDTFGEGGPDVILLARDRCLGTEVAIRMPVRDRLDAPQSSRHLIREIRALARLTHPNLVGVTDLGEHDGVPFAVLEHPSGGSLKFRRPTGPDGRPAPAKPESLASWLPQVAGALDFLHARGYVHGDVRPANILFDTHGHVHLAPSLAMRTHGGSESVPTRRPVARGAMPDSRQDPAPEPRVGQAYDGGADQHALALAVYEWLSGRESFVETGSTAAPERQAAEGPPELHRICPSAPVALSWAVQRGLSRDPARCYPNCTSFSQAIMSAIRDGGVPLADRDPGPQSSRGATATDVPGVAAPKERPRTYRTGTRTALGVGALGSTLAILAVAFARRTAGRRKEHSERLIPRWFGILPHPARRRLLGRPDSGRLPSTFGRPDPSEANGRAPVDLSATSLACREFDDDMPTAAVNGRRTIGAGARPRLALEAPLRSPHDGQPTGMLAVVARMEPGSIRSQVLSLASQAHRRRTVVAWEAERQIRPMGFLLFIRSLLVPPPLPDPSIGPLAKNRWRDHVPVRHGWLGLR
jgi:Protein kinase domain